MADETSLEAEAGKALEKQLWLLSKHSEKANAEDLVALTGAMCQAIGTWQSLLVGGAVSFPAQVQLTAQDLADLHRGQYDRVSRSWTDSQKSECQAP